MRRARFAERAICLTDVGRSCDSRCLCKPRAGPRGAMMTIYVPLLGLLWRTVESYGIDPHTVIDAADYRPSDTNQMSSRIAFTRYDRIVAIVTDLVNDPASGLRTAEQIHPSHFGALGYAWLASSSLLTALLRASRYVRMLDEQTAIRIEIQEDQVVVITETLASLSRPDHWSDFQVACLVTLCRFNYGPTFRPERVMLKRVAPEKPDPWSRFFNCPVNFGADTNAMVLSSEVAKQDLPTSNPELVMLHELLIVRSLARLDRTDIADRVKAEIFDQLPSGSLTAMKIADALGISKRSLQRRLKARGSSLGALLTETRRELAAHYVADFGLSLGEVSFLLGYSDLSAFSRAYRRWFGKSPRQARDHNLHGPAGR